MRFIFSILCLLLTSCEYENIEINMNAQVVKYSTHISPIILRSCAVTGCHTQGAMIGDFAEYSNIKSRIDNGKFQIMVFDLELMPPSNYSSLTNEEYGKLKSWVEQGALNN